MTQTKFDTSKKDIRLIHTIVKRAMKFPQLKKVDMISVEMDVTATHCNGCKLDLIKFLSFDDFNLMHDVIGIMNHIDRTTGKLTKCFLPRCSK